ncbi:GNAT family N-acetyltransferase [Agarilytica rhodophyticola]|uniref:GNAT family N-acetyltransferase n=1 Tax=Agarilytica rhodophyticola TaxID=1737490 RepID=UPI000B3424E7|nr:GNAT family N-acetyltransferase [Agarilytica rhodophyticola]
MIETVESRNLNEVLPLIREYQEFYQVADISDSRNKEFFSQFSESSDLGCLFLYRQHNKAVAFATVATVYFSYASTIATKVAVLNDLYTKPNERRNNIGKKLIEHCRLFAAKKGAARLQWVTALDNKPAQKLYESLPTKKSTWHFYTYNI